MMSKLRPDLIIFVIGTAPEPQGVRNLPDHPPHRHLQQPAVGTGDLGRGHSCTVCHVSSRFRVVSLKTPTNVGM